MKRIAQHIIIDRQIAVIAPQQDRHDDSVNLLSLDLNTIFR